MASHNDDSFSNGVLNLSIQKKGVKLNIRNETELNYQRYMVPKLVENV